MAEVITFKKDGTYDEILYGQIKIKGEWSFDKDSLKLKLGMTSFNGNDVPGIKMKDAKPTDTILKLSADTLIYGSLAYYGAKKEYGHDDWYFVADPH